VKKKEALGQVFQVVPRSSHVTKYDFTWDERNNIIHIRDWGERGTFSVLHALKYCPLEFVVNLREQMEHCLFMKLQNWEFKIYLYTHDPYVFEFDDGQLIPIDIVDFDKIHSDYMRKKGKYKHVHLE
jgi:hypothetical protein